jgi:hypothetical protein
MAFTSKYSKTYTSFSGSDIVCTFNNIVIGELQSVTYSVTREKAPIYTMGNPNPRSFSRGKRGIAGSLVFSVFDRDALAELKAQQKITMPYMNKSRVPINNYGSTGGDTAWNQAMGQKVGADGALEESAYMAVESQYADEIPPFDITINFQNEYGQKALMRLYGVELLNEGMGMSIDDITTEKAVTFVAREIEHLHPVG